MSPSFKSPVINQPCGIGSSNSLPNLRIGDVVFIRIGAYPFRQVAAATGSWTNHVGVVVSMSGGQAVVGESRFPFSGTTSLARFVARSVGQRVAVSRLKAPLTPTQEASVQAAARARNGIFYDTGFDFHSRHQFCSRYVHEVLHQATGVRVGEVQSFRELLASRPNIDLGFWRTWYFGSIPWKRQTVTPASLLASPKLEIVFDSANGMPQRRAAPNAASRAARCAEFGTELGSAQRGEPISQRKSAGAISC